MCGIAGKITFDEEGVQSNELERMTRAIVHRGPDDTGIFLSNDKKVGLANCRLAIVDLSKRGHQPMTYKNRYWITYNGEVYNFLELRKELIQKGYRFKSETDTEVILALYDLYGTDCLRYLRGMFAFAIYDVRRKTVFLARDRVGKKPLKYFFGNDTFIFASEIGALVTQKEVKREPDWIAIHHFLTYGYTPAPMTGFVGIKKLEPAHYLIVDIKNRKVTKRRYWQLDFNHKLNLSENEWSERILSNLEEATKLRMIADVPIGVFLSGGVDSSGVVATMARLSKDPVKTFTICFKERKYDEREYARNISDLYGTEHEEILAQSTSIETLQQLVEHYGEPYADSSALVAYMVSKAARKYVTVVLNGDGGDENFAGYDRHRKISRDVIADRYVWFLRNLGLPVLKIAKERVNPPKLNQIYRFLLKSRQDLAARYVSYNCIYLPEQKENLYTKEFREKLAVVDSYDIFHESFELSNAKDPRDAGLFADISLYLPDDLLTKVDIASMASSLEGRSPMLDHVFMEMAAQIPYDLKVKNGETKYIQKKAFEKIVPAENLYRTKKGFSVPLEDWFSGGLNKYARGRLLRRGAMTKGLFNKEAVRNMLDRHGKSEDFGQRLWALLTLELWFESYFK